MRIGIDFGGTNIKSGLYEESGEIIKFREDRLTEFTDGNLLENLVRHAEEFAEGYSLSGGGLAIKGLINTETGVLEDDIGAGQMLAGVDLRSAFGSSLKIPFKVDNDARAYAMGEFKFGAGRGSKAMVCMTLGTGFGCTAIAEGRPYYGADALGGLLGGHISIDKNGPECPCGNRGCLELYCSATAFIQRIREAHEDLKESRDVLPEFFTGIQSRNSKYLKTLHDFQEDLAIGIVNAIHAYGPDTVVLGGGVMNSAPLIMPRLTEIVQKRAWTFPRGKVQIKRSLLGNKAASMGIAFL